MAYLSLPQFLLVVAFSGVSALLWLRKRLYPKPYPGIPYHEASANRILGDAPSLLAHFAKHHTTFDWLAQQCVELNSPIVQIFLKPFGAPWIVVADHWESEDVLSRRVHEFGRSHFFDDIFAGIIPKATISMPSHSEFKVQRRLFSDTMSPSYLSNNASPLLFARGQDLCQLLARRIEMAQGRCFEVFTDISYAILDALWQSFSGKDAGSVRAQIAFLSTLDKLPLPSSAEDPVVFPRGPSTPFFDATMTISDGMNSVATSPVPRLHSQLLPYLPSQRKAFVVKDQILTDVINETRAQHLAAADGQLDANGAMDLVMSRNLKLVEKHEPPVSDKALLDELFSLVVGGHETSAAALTTTLKFLADNPQPQAALREALQSSLPPDFTAHDLAQADVPYLTATIDEALRLAGPASGINRLVKQDTEVLGHPIPKGAIVWFMNNGPSYRSPPIESGKGRRTPHAQALHEKVKPWDAASISEFNPQRWLKTDEKGHTTYDVHAGPNLSFSAGARGCFGKRLAYVQLRIFLTLLVLRFEFLKLPDKLHSYEQITHVADVPLTSYMRMRPVVS